MVRRLIRVFANGALLLSLAAPAWAGLAEGVAAYERGDYRSARPLIHHTRNCGGAS